MSDKSSGSSDPELFKRKVCMKKAIATFLVLTFIMVSFSGCGGQPGAPSQGDAGRTSAGDAVVARVGDFEIFYSQMANQMVTLEAMYNDVGGQYTEGQVKDLLNQAARSTLENLINSHILDMKIEEYQITLTKEEERQGESRWQALLEDTKQAVQAEQPDLTGGELEDMVDLVMGYKGLDKASVYESTLRSLKLEKLRSQLASELPEPDQQEISAVYDSLLAQQKAAFDADVTAFESTMLDGDVVVYVPRDYRVMRQLDLSFEQDVINILKQLETYDSVDGDTYREMEKNELRLLKEEKIPVIKGLLEQGLSFSQIMEETKPGSSKRVNYICQDSTRFSDDYYAAAFSIPAEGRLAGEPVRQKYGYSLLYWDSSIPAGVISLQTAREQIRLDLMKKAENEHWKTLQDQWRAQADVTIYESVFSY